MPCVVHYFTGEKTDKKKDCYSIGERVLERLEYLEIEGRTVRGYDLSMQIEDDILQVFVTYRYWSRKIADEYDKMEVAEISNVNTKN
jgi:hypothetical protein